MVHVLTELRGTLVRAKAIAIAYIDRVTYSEDLHDNGTRTVYISINVLREGILG